MVGHLGSFLERKVTDVLQTKKDKNDTSGDVTFTVSQKKARGRDIQDWKFRVLPIDSWGRPQQEDAVAPKAFKYTADEIKQWITDHQGDLLWPSTLTDIRNIIFKEACGVKANNDLQQCINIAINSRFIIPQPAEEFTPTQKKPKYYLNGEVIEIKDIPF